MQYLSKINVADLQTAIDRAEVNGPLKSLNALHETLAKDAVWNRKGVGAQQVRNRLLWAFNQDLTTSQTYNAKKVRKASRAKHSSQEAIIQLKEIIKHLSENKNTSVKIHVQISA